MSYKTDLSVSDFSVRLNENQKDQHLSDIQVYISLMKNKAIKFIEFQQNKQEPLVKRDTNRCHCNILQKFITSKIHLTDSYFEGNISTNIWTSQTKLYNISMGKRKMK